MTSKKSSLRFTVEYFTLLFAGKTFKIIHLITILLYHVTKIRLDFRTASFVMWHILLGKMRDFAYFSYSATYYSTQSQTNSIYEVYIS